MKLRGLARALVAASLACVAIVDAAEPTVETATRYGCVSEPRDYRSGFWSRSDPSGVFWCKREAKKNPARMADERIPPEEMEFLLVVLNRDPNRHLACPHSVPMINEPLNLRVQWNKKIPLNHFVYAAVPSKSGPKGQVTTGPVIDTGDDSAGHVWYCHRGQWLVLFYH